eukprot:7095838-Prymnesium_polylepis.1
MAYYAYEDCERLLAPGPAPVVSFVLTLCSPTDLSTTKVSVCVGVSVRCDGQTSEAFASSTARASTGGNRVTLSLLEPSDNFDKMISFSQLRN